MNDKELIKESRQNFQQLRFDWKLKRCENDERKKLDNERSDRSELKEMRKRNRKRSLCSFKSLRCQPLSEEECLAKVLYPKFLINRLQEGLSTQELQPQN